MSQDKKPPQTNVVDWWADLAPTLRQPKKRGTSRAWFDRSDPAFENVISYYEAVSRWRRKMSQKVE